MIKRLPHLSLVLAAAMCLAVAPAMATDEVPAPPAPPAPAPGATAPPSTGGLCTDNSRPSARIRTSAAGAGRKLVVRGTASDRGCGAAGRGSLARVTISVQRKRGSRCQYMSSRGRLGGAKSCARPNWLSARGTSNWSFALPKRLPHGSYVVRVRALDSAGNTGSQRSLRVRIR